MKESEDLQAIAGFGVKFKWDLPMFDNYRYLFIDNHSALPSSSRKKGVVVERTEVSDLLKKLQTDVVIVNGWFPEGNLQVIKLCHRLNIPVICRGDSHLKMRGSKLINFAKKIYLTPVLNRISHFLEVGYLNGAFYEFMGVPAHRRSAAFHCIDTEFFRNEAGKCSKTSGEKVNIGFAGKFIDKKKPLELMSAISFSKYKSRIKLIFVGDGPLHKDMLEYSRRNEIEVEFTGFLNQTEIVGKGYCHMDALVISSSHNETWGLVANEAMTCGIPVIISDMVGCGPDLVEEGRTGFIYPSGRPEQLGQKIDRFIEALDNGFDFRSRVLKKIEKYSLNSTIEGFMAAINKFAC